MRCGEMTVSPFDPWLVDVAIGLCIGCKFHNDCVRFGQPRRDAWLAHGALVMIDARIWELGPGQ